MRDSLCRNSEKIKAIVSDLLPIPAKETKENYNQGNNCSPGYILEDASDNSENNYSPGYILEDCDGDSEVDHNVTDKVNNDKYSSVPDATPEKKDHSNYISEELTHNDSQKKDKNNTGDSSVIDNKWPYEDEPLDIPPEFWSKYWSQDKKLLSGRTDDFNNIFNITHPICVLRFEWHKCAHGVSQRRSFQAVASCKHSLCTKYRFVYVDAIQEPHVLRKIQVFRDKPVLHLKGEAHRRFVKGAIRKRLAEELLKYSAAKKKLKMIADVPPGVLEHGNLNRAPSSMILQKISSDYTARNDLSPDTYQFILKLMEKFKETWRGKVVCNYIQHFSLRPFGVVLFTEDQLRLLLRQETAFVFFYSTGSIFAKPLGIEKAMYYYSMILAGIEAEDKGPICVAEYISSAHSVPFITNFLMQFNYAIRLLSPREPYIHKLETDYSLALLQSASLALNKMSLIDYVNCVAQNSVRLQSMTVHHVCSSHMLKTALKQFRLMSMSQQQIAIATKAMANLIYVDSLDKGLKVYECMLKLFVYETSEQEVKACMKSLEDFSNIDQLDEGVEESSMYYDFDEIEFQTTLKKSDSIYFRKFSARSEALSKMYKSSNAKDNKLYCPQLMKYVLGWWLPYFAVWSAVQINHKFDLLRDSNAPVENWQKIIKHQVYDGKKKINVARFIQQQEELLPARIRERDQPFALMTERQKKKKQQNESR